MSHRSQQECSEPCCRPVDIDDPGRDPEIVELVAAVACGLRPVETIAQALRTMPAGSSGFRKLAKHLSMARMDEIEGKPSVSMPAIPQLVSALIDALMRTPADSANWRMEAYASGADATAFNLLRAISLGAEPDPAVLLARLDDVFGVIVRRMAFWRTGAAGTVQLLTLLCQCGQYALLHRRRPLCAIVPDALKVLAAVYADEHLRVHHPRALASMLLFAKPAVGYSIDGPEADLIVAGRLRTFLAQSGLAAGFARTLVHMLQTDVPTVAHDSPYEFALCLLPVVGDKTALTTGHIRKELIDAGLLPIIARLIGRLGLHKPDADEASQLYSRAFYTVSGWLTEMRFETSSVEWLIDHGYLERLALALCTPPDQHGTSLPTAPALTHAEPEAYCTLEYKLGHLASALRGNKAGLAPILKPRFETLYRPVIYYHRQRIYPALVSSYGPSSPLVKTTREALLMWANIGGNLDIEACSVDATTEASRYRPCARFGCTRSERDGVVFSACGGCRIFCASARCCRSTDAPQSTAAAPIARPRAGATITRSPARSSASPSTCAEPYQVLYILASRLSRAQLRLRKTEHAPTLRAERRSGDDG